MPLFNLPTEANAGLVPMLQYLAGEVPVLFPSILFFYFVVATIVGYNIDNARNQNANIWMWLTVNSFITSFAAVVLAFIPGVLDIYTVSISIGLMLMFLALFVFSNKD